MVELTKILLKKYVKQSHFFLPATIFWLGGAQNLERRNVERPILRNFKIANIKITKYE